MLMVAMERPAAVSGSAPEARERGFALFACANKRLPCARQMPDTPPPAA